MRAADLTNDTDYLLYIRQYYSRADVHWLSNYANVRFIDELPDRPVHSSTGSIGGRCRPPLAPLPSLVTVFSVVGPHIERFPICDKVMRWRPRLASHQRVSHCHSTSLAVVAITNAHVYSSRASQSHRLQVGLQDEAGRQWTPTTAW